MSPDPSHCGYWVEDGEKEFFIQIPKGEKEAMKTKSTVTILVSLTLLAISMQSAAQAADCVPSFRFGFAALHHQLGDPMGDPVECERANPERRDPRNRQDRGTGHRSGAESHREPLRLC